MIDQENLILLGKITKRKGFKGEVIALLEEVAPDNFSFPEFIFVSINDNFIPLHLSDNYPQSSKTYALSFTDHSETLIDKILDKNIYLHKDDYPHKDSDTNIERESIKGYSVYDKKRGFVGVINSVIDRDIQPLVVVLNKNKEILLPYTDTIFLKTDHHKKSVNINAPEGLLDLYR